MQTPAEHPQRYDLVRELHARPFARISAPAQVVYVAIKEPQNAAGRDRAADRAHLVDLLARHGAPLPEPGETHHETDLGRWRLKWESHTEFTAFMAAAPGVPERPFDPAEAEIFPAAWLAAAPGGRVAAVQIRIEVLPDDPAEINAKLDAWFVPESLSVAWVLDRAAVVAGDFRLDPAGQMRFAIFAHKDTGPGRIGRIVQRLCEIETYRAMSMLGLARARRLMARLNDLEDGLLGLVDRMAAESAAPEATLHDLLGLSAELERMAVAHSFRFGATAAYEALVIERVGVLREERFEGRQKFSEFMMRRYDPAVRTVKSAESRLGQILLRAARAGELLRTRVDVARQAQNQKLLESMDRRSDLQLKLQHTVEGLSVVAISYYAVSLAGYIAYPLAKHFGIAKEMMIAGLAPVVVLGVWLMIRRIHKGVGGH